MKKAIAVILFTLAIVNLVGVVVFTIGNNERAASSSQNQNPSGADVVSTQTGLQSNGDPEQITLQALSLHSFEKDCWIAYENNVYDITDWLPKHPGSANAIAPFCGTASEFEKAFTDQHGKSQVERLVSEGIYKGVLK